MIPPVLSLVFMVLGTGFFMTFTSLSLEQAGFPVWQIGLVQGCYYLGMLLCSLKIDTLISRVGHIRVIAAASGILAAAHCLQFLTSEVLLWALSRLAAGACVGSFYIGVESWLLAEAPKKKRGTALGLYTIALYLAQSLSQVFLDESLEATAQSYVYSIALISLASIPVCVSYKRGPEISIAEPQRFTRMLGVAPLGIWSCFVAGILLSTLYTLLPVYVDHTQVDVSNLMAVLILGGGALQWPIGKISDFISRKIVLLGVAVLSLIPVLLLSFSVATWQLYLNVFFLGGLLFTLYPIAMALVCDKVSDRDLIRAIGALTFVYGLGSVIGPVLTPFLKFWTPYYVPLALAIGVGSILIAGIILRSKPVKPADKVDFIPLPRGPLTDQLNPNIDD